MGLGQLVYLFDFEKYEAYSVKGMTFQELLTLPENTWYPVEDIGFPRESLFEQAAENDPDIARLFEQAYRVAQACIRPIIGIDCLGHRSGEIVSSTTESVQRNWPMFSIDLGKLGMAPRDIEALIEGSERLEVSGRCRCLPNSAMLSLLSKLEALYADTEDDKTRLVERQISREFVKVLGCCKRMLETAISERRDLLICISR
jgi:hypothetical protein